MSDEPIDTELVHGEIVDGIATLTLDSPANRNALSARLVGELTAHLSVAGVDPSVRAVVLTHTGNTFCAGADLAESAREGGPMAGTERLVGLLRQIVELPKPVVAVVDGNVRAGGLGLLGACDLVMASRASSSSMARAASRVFDGIGMSPVRASGASCTSAILSTRSPSTSWPSARRASVSSSATSATP